MDRHLTAGSIRRGIIGFAIPIFIGYLFQQLYNTADSLIVGNYLGENALAAVSSNGAFTYLFIGIAFGIGFGWLFDPVMLPQLGAMMVGQYLCKFVLAALDTPFFYVLTRKHHADLQMAHAKN